MKIEVKLQELTPRFKAHGVDFDREFAKTGFHFLGKKKDVTRIRFRPQRRTLAEAMDELVVLDATLQALADHYNATVKIGPPIEAGIISVKPYYGFDERIGWDTHIVTAPNFGVLGFTDGPVNE